MIYLIIEQTQQLGWNCIVESKEGITYIDTQKQYLHYDEIEPFVKYNVFKGISVSIDNTLVLQFTC